MEQLCGGPWSGLSTRLRLFTIRLYKEQGGRGRWIGVPRGSGREVTGRGLGGLRIRSDPVSFVIERVERGESGQAQTG